MKLKKVFFIGFICAMLMGCARQNQMDNTTKDEEPVEAKTGLQRVELNEKENFYLNVFDNGSAITYDANWKEESINKLIYCIYQYEDGGWKKTISRELALEEDGAWIAINPDLSAFKIAVKSGSSAVNSVYHDLLPVLWNDGFGAENDSAKFVNIETDKEIAVVVYHQFHTDSMGKNIKLSAFEHPEEVQADENNAYYILTFMFK